MNYFVSDLHMDDGTGEFTPNSKAFNNFLDLVGNENLFVVGDCLDLWRWSANKIMNGPNRKVINRLIEKPNVSLLLGNHDLDLNTMKSIFQDKICMSTTIEGWTVIHGHQLDFRLDTVKERNFVKNLSLVIQKINCPAINYVRDKFSSSDRNNTMYKNKFSGVKLIMGHTHIPEQTEDYLNTGSWIGKDLTYVLMNGKIQLLRMEK